MSTGVMHLIDALDRGGAEQVAVNLVNLLPRERYRPHLCTTRRDGPLIDEVAGDVGRLSLNRRRRIDVRAILDLRAYIAAHDIRLLHAHETALFTATMAAMLPPFPRVVWHDHFGRHGIEQRSAALYRLPARRAAAVLTVSRPLAAWATDTLGVPAARVHYVPNFVVPPAGGDVPDLPGTAGTRVVCVANFRAQKDHLTLLRAMSAAVARVPDAHLLLIGAEVDPVYAADVRRECVRLGLQHSVSFLGSRRDVFAILGHCDVGVLSSASEGLPLSLIEYGYAGLAVVATRVGECSDVLDGGRAGVIVPPADPAALGDALVALLQDATRRRTLGGVLGSHVRATFGAAAIMDRVTAIYDSILRDRSGL